MLYAFEVGFILLFAGIMVYAQKNQTNFNTLAESNGKKIVIEFLTGANFLCKIAVVKQIMSITPQIKGGRTVSLFCL